VEGSPPEGKKRVPGWEGKKKISQEKGHEEKEKAPPRKNVGRICDKKREPLAETWCGRDGLTQKNGGRVPVNKGGTRLGVRGEENAVVEGAGKKRKNRTGGGGVKNRQRWGNGPRWVTQSLEHEGKKRKIRSVTWWQS